MPDPRSPIPMRKPIREYQTPNPSDGYYTELVNNTDANYRVPARGTLYSTNTGGDPVTAPLILTLFTALYFLREIRFKESDTTVMWLWGSDPTAEDTYNAEISYMEENVSFPAFTRAYTMRRDVYEATPELAIYSTLTGLVGVHITAQGAGYTKPIFTLSGGGSGIAVQGVLSPTGQIISAIVTDEGTGLGSGSTIAITDTAPGTGSGATCAPIIQPASAILVAQKKIELPDDHPMRFEYVRVIRSYRTLDGPVQTSYIQNRQTQVASTVTVQEIKTAEAALPTPTLGQNVEFEWQSAAITKKKISQISATQTENFYMTFPGQGDLQLPLQLLAVNINWDVTQATGSYAETGSGAAEGSSANLSLTASGSSHGSGSVLGDIIPTFAPEAPRDLPFIDFYFFLPTPVSLAQILTAASVFYSVFTGSATTVNEWPVFQTQPHTFWMSGQKFSVGADVRVSCAVSLVVSDTETSASLAQTAGQGTSGDAGSSVKSVTIRDSIHGAITLIGPQYVGVGMFASATARLASGTNWPGGYAMDQAFGGAFGGVDIVSLAATPVAAYPSSGIYLYNPQCSPGEDGYTTIRARLFDFGILTNGITLGQPQITVADFNGLTGADFKVAQAQITTFNFTGQTGRTYQSGLPQITNLVFTGLGGSHFVTGAAGLYWSLYDENGDFVVVWYNTGTETQPTVAGATAYLEITVSPVGSANGVASNTVTQMTAAYYPAVFQPYQPVLGTPVITVTTILAGPTINAADGNTGATITTTQTGVAASSGHALILPSATGGNFGVWFTTGLDTQPNLTGYSVATYIQVNITPVSTSSQIAAAFQTAMNAYTSTWTNSISSNTVTLTSIALGAQAAAADVNTGAAITVTQTGGSAGKYFNIYGYQGFNPTPIWFNTGTETQPTPTGLQVSISPTATATQIASAVVAQIPALIGPTWIMALINGAGTNTAARFTASANRMTINAADVNSGAAITTTQEGQPANA